MRILLVGAGGQLAEDLRRSLTEDNVVAVGHAGLDIRDAAAVKAIVDQVAPECIINTAAFNLVDTCEDRAEEAFATNALGPYHLARAAQQRGAALLHFSTNYVFDGTKATSYVETDPPRPLSVYAMSKLAGEWFVQTYCEKYLLVRTAALYGAAGNRSKGGNFVERMLQLAGEGKPIRVVNDQLVNPTNTKDLAEAVVPLIRGRRYGLYHITNSGGSSWYDFAREVFRLAGVSANLIPVSTEAFQTKARRPANSMLESRALRVGGLSELRPWQDALADYLRTRR